MGACFCRHLCTTEHLSQGHPFQALSQLLTRILGVPNILASFHSFESSQLSAAMFFHILATVHSSSPDAAIPRYYKSLSTYRQNVANSITLFLIQLKSTIYGFIAFSRCMSTSLNVCYSVPNRLTSYTL